ncbi:Type III restriction enzyme, res subunit [Nodularia spumigena CCY9414]|nr:Type III restriction enzyme, res subunit [Nodularia spumigena CCY9414]
MIWLAYSEELCEQAVTEFQKAWDCVGVQLCWAFTPSHHLNLPLLG